MVVNLIVLGVTLLMAMFVGVWVFFPRLRTWMEEPKYRFLERQRREPPLLRDERQGRSSSVVKEPYEANPARLA